MEAFNDDFKNMFDTFTTELNATMESLRKLQGTSETMQSAPPALKSSHLSQVMEELKEAEASMKRQVSDLSANVCSGLQSVESASKKMEDEKRKLESQYTTFQTAINVAQSLEQRCMQDVESAKQETARSKATHEKIVADHSERLHDLECLLADARDEAEEAKTTAAKLQTDLTARVEELQHARREAQKAKSDAAELRIQVNEANAAVENFQSSLEDLRAAQVAYQQKTAKAAKSAADAEELQRNMKARSDASGNHRKEVADDLQQRQDKLEEAERALAANQSVEGVITSQLDHTAKRLEGRFDATERAIHLLHPAVMDTKGAIAVVDNELGDLRVEITESFRMLFNTFGSVQDSVQKSFACVDDTQQQLLVVKANTEESNAELRRLVRQLETSGKVTVQSSRKRSIVEDFEAGPSKRPHLVQNESSALVPADITADESTLVEHTHGEILGESVAARPAAREAAIANLAPDTQRELSAEDGEFAGIRSMIEFPAAWTNERSSDCWSALVEKTGSVPELLKLLERAASGNRRAKPGPATCLMEIGNKSGFVTEGDGLRRGDCPVHSRSGSVGFCLYIERAPGTGRVTEVAVGTTSWLVRERPE